MAKDLPYFKFYCSEWTDGDITLENYETQGVFINICSYYWSKECNISHDKLFRKFKNNKEDIMLLLDNEIIKKEGDFIVISFLDEQLAERELTSNKNSIAGKASAEARRLRKLEREADKKPTSVEIPLNENPTIKKRGEEKREDKKIEFNVFWDLYEKKVGSKPKCKKKWDSLPAKTQNKIIESLPAWLKQIKDKQFQPHPLTYLNNERWNDELQGTKKVVLINDEENAWDNFN